MKTGVNVHNGILNGLSHRNFSRILQLKTLKKNYDEMPSLMLKMLR